MAEPTINTAVQGGIIYGVAGAGTVIIENFYAGSSAPPAQVAPEAANAGPLPPCPYPGLAYFGPQDRAQFFGREKAILALIDAVPRHGLTALVGASGSGKSSVVLAGLAPRLAATGDWAFSYFRVGTETDKDPFVALARALVPLFFDASSPVDRLSEIGNLARRLQSGDIALGNVLGECRLQRRKRILLVADQFEEVFTLVGDEAVRQRFIDVLLSGFAEAEAASSPQACLLLTMRADFYNMALRYRPLSDAIQGRVENLGPMTRDELREAIERPAGDVVYEQGLVDTLLDDVASRPGNLPLLQFALREMWSRQEAGHITHKSYQDIGRVEGALARRAHEIFEKITKSGSDEATVTLFRRLFTRMVTLGEGAEDTRRVVSRRELGDEAWNLAQQLADEDNRLVVTGAIAAGNETAEVVHEALIRHWPDLIGWVGQDREFQTWLRQIRPRVDEWLKARTDEGNLLRGGSLAVAEEWLHSRGDELADEEREFIQSSAGARDAEARRREEQAAATRRRQFRIVVASGMAAAVCAGLAILAAAQWHLATTAYNAMDVIQRLARYTGDSGGKPQRSVLLGVEAALMSGDRQSASQLAEIDTVRQQLRAISGEPLLGHEQATQIAAFSHSGRWLATGSDDGTVRLWELGKRAPAGTTISTGSAQVSALAFARDDKRLFGADQKGQLRSWRLAEDGAAADKNWNPGYGAVTAMATSPGGDWLAFATQSGKLCLWQLSGGDITENPCEQYPDPITMVRFSANGRWLAAATRGQDNGKVRLWDLSTGSRQEPPAELAPANHYGEPSLNAIAFSADGRRLAAAYGYNAEVWDLTQSDPPQHVVGHALQSQWIMALDLSPDGRWLATGGIDTRVKLWDLAGTGEPVTLNGHSATVKSIAFSDDGNWLATAGDDATVQLWDFSNPRIIPSTALRGQDLPIEQVLFSPGAAPGYLVGVGNDRNARLWTLSHVAADPAEFHADLENGGIAVLSPDGSWIASSSRKDHTLLIWSQTDPREPVKKLPLAGAASAIAFSRDGRWLAVGDDADPFLQLWRFPDLDKQIKLSVRQPPVGEGLNFSPNNRWLVSGTWANLSWRTRDRSTSEVALWDVSGDAPSPTPKHVCREPRPVRAASFSPDGRYAAVALNDFSGLLLDLEAANPCVAPRVLGPHEDAVAQIAISPDGRWAATASFDGNGRLWDLRADGQPTLASKLPLGGRVTETAFSRDARWLAFSSWSGAIGLIDLRSPEKPRPIKLPGHEGRAFSVTFTPDSKLLISTGEDRTARLWDPNHPGEPPVVMHGHQGAVWLAGVSSDSRLMATYSDDGTVRLWHMQLPDLFEIACHAAGRQFTQEEIDDYLQGKPAAPACTGQPKAAN